MKQILNKVTATGADDSVNPLNLVEIAKEFPFAEFGILFSASAEGHVRYPTHDWVKELFALPEHRSLSLAAHICGKWVKEICLGNWSVLNERPEIGLFKRIQLNFHAYKHLLNIDEFVKNAPSKQIILQVDGVNDDFVKLLREKGMNVVSLFDLSGGCGVLPEVWPEDEGHYSGYAGGLSPDNVTEQLELISKKTSHAWIDAESHLFTSNYFDLSKVRKFFSAAKPWVKT